MSGVRNIYQLNSELKQLRLDLTPYQLTADIANNIIYARGPLRVTRTLRRLHGCNIHKFADHQDDFLWMPATRLNFMACEAVASPDTVTSMYMELRERAMRASKTELQLWDHHVHDAFRRPLLHHQRDFCARNLNTRGQLNAAEQGTGKTAAALALGFAWRCTRQLVVCPKSLAGEWINEAHQLFGDHILNEYTFTQLIDVPLTERRNKLKLLAPSLSTGYHVVVVNYEVLYELKEAILVNFRPDLLVCDESWKVKSPSAQVTKAYLQISQRTAHCLNLTGTPIGNDVGDLWAQLAGPDHGPGGLNSLSEYDEFMQLYSQQVPVQLGSRVVMKPVGCLNPTGLMECMEPLWWRVTQASCFELPPKQYHLVKLSLSTTARQLYRQTEQFGEAALGDELSLNGSRVILLRLQQLTSGWHPEYVAESDDIESCLERYDLRPMDSPKLNWLLQFTRDRLQGEPTTRCMVWCRFNADVYRITEELQQLLGQHRVVACTGSTEQSLIEAAKASFQSRDPEGVQVLVCQIKKMAFGHNLQAGDHHIVYSWTWSYVEHSQSEARSMRYGREEPVHYWHLVIENSVDEQIVAALERKEDLSERLAIETR